MKFRKLFAAIVTAVAIMAMLLCFTACGGAAKPTGSFLSENQIRYMNFHPTFNYRTLTSTTQQLDTYDDGTYCLTVTAVTYSNVTFGQDVPSGEATWNDRGQVVTKYYGTCEIVVDSEDSTIEYVTISTPTRVAYSSFGSYTVDTGAEWTEQMTEAASIKDSQSGEIVTEISSAEAFIELKTEGFPAEGIEIMVSLTTCNFDQVSWGN